MKKERTKERGSWSRRRFLGGTLAAIAGVGMGPRVKGFVQEKPAPSGEGKVGEFRTLGRTGFKASDVGLGAGQMFDPALFEAVLDAGINYIDTAEGYGRGRSERTIGQVLKKRDRKSIFITTKLPFWGPRTKEAFLDRTAKCLERLQTEYVDCLMIHMAGSAADIKDEAFHAAAKQLKADGKVRFLGISNHGLDWNMGRGSASMDEVCLAAAEDGRFDVMLFVYNFLQRERGEKILKACREKNIGATLMKTNPYHKYLDMKAMKEKSEEDGKDIPPQFKNFYDMLEKMTAEVDTFKKSFNLDNPDEVLDAALKFTLAHPDVHSICPTIKNFDELKKFVSLSGQKFTTADLEKLAAYEKTYGKFYCRHACGECELKCPQNVAVNTVMRYSHYFRAQGREKMAMEKYAALSGRQAEACSSCSGHCQKACPFGVPVQVLLVKAHETLTLS